MTPAPPAFAEPSVHDHPINGINIQLNFAAEEAERTGRRPTGTAADAKEQPASTG